MRLTSSACIILVRILKLKTRQTVKKCIDLYDVISLKVIASDLVKQHVPGIELDKLSVISNNFHPIISFIEYKRY